MDPSVTRLEPRRPAPDSLSFVIVLLLAIGLVGGLAASVSAAPALPSCRLADSLTKYHE